MDANSFEFTMTMPGDTRLVGIVRDLAVHAARFAQVAPQLATAFVNEAASAAQVAIDLTESRDAPIEFRFVRAGATLDLFITCEVVDSSRLPTPEVSGGLSVDWTRDGSTQVCHIRQQMPA